MNTLFYNAKIVNEGKTFIGYIGICDNLIIAVGEGFPERIISKFEKSVDLKGALLLPGIIDDQVHFRDPGLTHKADILTESMAAVAGGVTSFMDMPNTKPQTITVDLLESKNRRASEVSLANYAFYIGATNDNYEELLKVDFKKTPGIKLFLGASTGNMLVDNDNTLDKIFSLDALIAIHSEDEEIIRRNASYFKSQFEEVPISCHSLIRSEDACYKSTFKAVERAKRLGTRLHVLHLSTARELELFSIIPLSDKKITSEVCVHHLWFTDADYIRLGSKIKWNPAIKTSFDRDALRNAVKTGQIDIVATDHAPHLLEEKEGDALHAASGGPMVQHSLVTMLELVEQGVFTIEKVVDVMSHRPAELFRIEKRGYLREGYYADLVILDKDSWTIHKENIFSKCGWSPLEGETLHYKVQQTYVNGQLVYDRGNFNCEHKGERLTFRQ